MKQIFLSQDKVALVDDEDYLIACQYRWYAVKGKYTWYATTRQKNNGEMKTLYLHRIIMRAKEGIEVDHIDGDGLNCIRENMRLCTALDNNRNRRIQRGNKSGYKGVRWDSRLEKWRSEISVKNKVTHLGVFIQKKDAGLAYNEAAKLYYGDFAKLNNIQVGG